MMVDLPTLEAKRDELYQSILAKREEIKTLRADYKTKADEYYARGIVLHLY